jgi:hypothetical protein
MALKPNQSKRGTQHGSDSNKTAKTGRDSGFGQTQAKRGTPRKVDGNASDRSTRPVPKETQGSRGTHGIRGGDGAGSVKRLPDDISSADGSY